MLRWQHYCEGGENLHMSGKHVPIGLLCAVKHKHLNRKGLK
jgi:hypothetical protein